MCACVNEGLLVPQVPRKKEKRIGFFYFFIFSFIDINLVHLRLRWFGTFEILNINGMGMFLPYDNALPELHSSPVPTDVKKQSTTDTVKI